MHPEARTWIEKLQLIPHPEGGWYRETYRSSAQVKTPRGQRPAGTVIYFLLAGTDKSHLHRLQADEVWHFYAGGPLQIQLLTEQGPDCLPLGPHALQAVVPARTWFGACLMPDAEYALVGCSMAPGFDFADFEMGQQDELLLAYPAQQELIKSLSLH